MTVILETSAALAGAVESAEARFARANPLSYAQHERALRTFPGGHTRQTLLYQPFPLTMTRGDGAMLTDLDGHRYLDLVGDYAAGVFGHSSPTIQKAALAAIDRGLSLGAINAYEIELAELISQRIPAMEQVRFCNSGSEACLYAALLACYATERNKLLVFTGAYHGGFMIYGYADLPLNASFDVNKCTYNDTEGTAAVLRAQGQSIAAVIVEPMMGAGGSIPATSEFLSMLRQETAQAGALLFFDEVMTSRLGPNGAQGLYAIRPDITTLGKFWGGGFNFGAFGGSRGLMQCFDTVAGGKLSQAGTFNNNSITMAAGLAGARDVYTADVCVHLNRLGDELRARLNALRDLTDVPFQVTGMGSVMTLHWHDHPINCPADTEVGNSLQRRLFQLEMMLLGFYVAQRGFIALSLALTETDLRMFVEAVREYLLRFRPLLVARS
jgi:glutamate-1-semialdehyde 2,1-aminomutase